MGILDRLAGEGLWIVDALCESGLAKSKGEARRTINQGGAYVNNRRIGSLETNLTADDLARNQADWIEPISIEIMGRRAWTIPPNSQGYLTLAAGWLFERLEPPPDPAGPNTEIVARQARSIALTRSFSASITSGATLTSASTLAVMADESKHGQTRRTNNRCRVIW